MNKIVGYVLAIAALCILAYAIYANAPRIPAPAESASAPAGTAMRVATEFDDSTAYRIEARYPQFGIPAVDEKVKAAVDLAIADFKTIPPNPPGSATPKNEFIGSFDAVYAGGDIVSVELLLSQDTGGAHPNTVAVGVNVEPKTGRELTLEDALALTGLSLEQVAAESLTQLKTKLGSDLISPQGADPKPENYNTFLVDTGTVTFVFQSYQVAPYSSGMQEVSFPRR
ncbi:hypothetical protein A3C20_01325 [Candidatus Kaiserbacteria bacterium RIFCSPHIGHO2_02_FULL_55_25]|uniref:DUF3298 domain-containing protein n=1 Tax=Candidatus Kaiserbacteria bacterium RIFCSPHIGHO2_02_FULL_55_25 TaxID=1798498 RepID=A0A1F6EAE8_9BACT|nr:MAG: hypothetical protein A2764_00425 [Candidatus Kaiserbacteria bacterium RIFCSPHIGHO2_01_FULL_55_79]OGG70638.1 MAG: hypothetical protein A3C20_01325 [Candidatus Kaiserbacteria bacterium RIFCSPHIGHO2_02_FULL_55_25]OGG78752.1 MAG: hypothetical protein A3F56_00885 [Candidatus Kaiserbacteria bacterium RIFCSPHIGHO2_12_FULL_55_13]OGG82714.1 MAG: hypothetical protein A3A42_02490 [Candidatus Kaiserbacteria bacterium RIFCSPLOWO2_01_FULL_55_25]